MTTAEASAELIAAAHRTTARIPSAETKSHRSTTCDPRAAAESAVLGSIVMMRGYAYADALEAGTAQ